MQYLDLSDTLLSGSIPLQISLLTNIEMLRLHRNMLRPPIPLNIHNLTRVTKLDLSFNKIICFEGHYLDFDNIGGGTCKSCFSNWYFLFSLKFKTNYCFLNI
jgi:Leucine-rich repeat (LRR) protein